MARRNISVVLRRDMDTLGVSGDVVFVRPGYARNYLIPRGIAFVASRDNLKQIEHEKSLARQRLEKKRLEAEEQAKAFKGVVLHVAKQVADVNDGKLFGSVTVNDVVEAFKNKGYEKIDKRAVVLPEEAIKFTGTYEIHLRLMAGVEVPIRLEVKTAA